MSAEEYISSLERENEKLRVRGQKDHDIIERLQAENERKDEALQVAYIALGDWVCEYAGELCDEDRVAEASERVHENGGLYYIGNAQSIVRKALKAQATPESTAPE